MHAFGDAAAGRDPLGRLLACWVDTHGVSSAAILGVREQRTVIHPDWCDAAAGGLKRAVKCARYPLTLLRGEIEHTNMNILRRRERVVVAKKCHLASVG